MFTVKRFNHLKKKRTVNQMKWIHMHNFVNAHKICKNYFYYLKKGQPTDN